MCRYSCGKKKVALFDFLDCAQKMYFDSRFSCNSNTLPRRLNMAYIIPDRSGPVYAYLHNGLKTAIFEVGGHRSDEMLVLTHE